MNKPPMISCVMKRNLTELNLSYINGRLAFLLKEEKIKNKRHHMAKTPILFLTVTRILPMKMCLKLLMLLQQLLLAHMQMI